MRRVIASCGLIVASSAVLGATVFREEVAQAAAAVLNVRVMNTAAEPVPVAGTVSISGTSTVQVATQLEPYEHSEFFNQGPTTCTQFVCEVAFPAVPAGKRLVVTYASARWRLTAGGTGPTARLGVNGNGIDKPQILLPAPEGIGFDAYVASGPVTFYANAGDVPTLSLGGQFVEPVSNTAHASIVGHLVSAP